MYTQYKGQNLRYKWKYKVPEEKVNKLCMYNSINNLKVNTHLTSAQVKKKNITSSSEDPLLAS